ncbi:hypothetical protein SAMD00019534_086990 [Acytostelium subglobosum LB1]|uniref:hypothetical protein n=1 Tax=Acytostelium subglobosum LB1 TaxID=1410327 RepID=UPI000644C98B|nr:hypothetical protein SAMD00019534_086990 [Acytostelium subglobosum LB1]GAM25524.1 hypothetical protein SAMD00019534_086990 [Acytostelium subglobosum LB1]|eukprot:XP_012751510.1 hypothetical protein SAMD00019534_086990 [Acytostelium subglobosum LB1]
MTIMKSISSLGNVASASAINKNTVSTSGALGASQSANTNAGLTQVVGGLVVGVENTVNGLLFGVLGAVDGLLGGLGL